MLGTQLWVVGSSSPAAMARASIFERLLPVEISLVAVLALAAGVAVGAYVARRVLFARWLARRRSELGPEALAAPDDLPAGAAAVWEAPTAGGLVRASGWLGEVGKRSVTLATGAAEGPTVAPGTPLRVMVAGDTAAYRFHSVVKSPGAGAVAGGLVLQRPAWVERIQRRAFFRIDVSAPAPLRVVAGRERGDGIDVTALVENLSGGGLRVSLPEQVHRGDTVRVGLPVPALGEARFEARVIDCVPRIGLTREDYVARLAFVHMPEETRNVVVQRCFELERMALRDKRGFP